MELVSKGYDGPYHVKSKATLTVDYSNRSAFALKSLNGDDYSLTSNSRLLRDAEKLGILDGLHASK